MCRLVPPPRTTLSPPRGTLRPLKGLSLPGQTLRGKHGRLLGRYNESSVSGSGGRGTGPSDHRRTTGVWRNEWADCPPCLLDTPSRAQKQQIARIPAESVTLEAHTAWRGQGPAPQKEKTHRGKETDHSAKPRRVRRRLWPWALSFYSAF